jgi:signal transduction histidine kinase
MAMPRWLSLRSRILVILIFLIFITASGGSVMIWYTYQMESLFAESIEKEMEAALAVEGLLQALGRHKGFVSYYFMDGDTSWLVRLEAQRKVFRESLQEAQRLVSREEDRIALERIASEYDQYILLKDQVVGLYKSGKREEGRVLHQEVRTHFDQILDACQDYETLQIRRMQTTQILSRTRASRMRVVAATAILTGVVLSLLLVFVMFRQVFGPIRHLLVEAERFVAPDGSGNEVKALSREVRGLIKEADQTHLELEKSRTRLVHSERMAMVGRLAAGVAHSIRNPLTSIKMRLFSLERALEVPPAQKEDLEVISEEIRHIDTIVRNFLEYARPSKLKMQKISPSDLIDMSLQLLRHRFQSYGVTIDLRRSEPLPEVLADPDQLKEVFMNLLINACEAVGEGGTITIEEQVGGRPPMGTVAMIRVKDNGPGIPAGLQEKVFEPFFSTKEEGTGLGLSIAVRIVEQHEGELSLASEEGQGTTFVITLPCREDENWAQS